MALEWRGTAGNGVEGVADVRRSDARRGIVPAVRMAELARNSLAPLGAVCQCRDYVSYRVTIRMCASMNTSIERHTNCQCTVDGLKLSRMVTSNK